MIGNVNVYLRAIMSFVNISNEIKSADGRRYAKLTRS